MQFSYFSYWGKARPDAGPVPYHLLPYHCLDVAAVAAVLWKGTPLLRSSFARLLGLSEDAARNLLLYLVALHDLGKFAAAFQHQAPEARKALAPSAKPPRVSKWRHDKLGYLLWGWELCETLDCVSPSLGESLLPLVAAVTGHHGLPPEASGNGFELKAHFHAEDLAAARAFAETLAALFQLELGDWVLDSELAAPASLYLAGFAMLCDWAGSNTDWFPYEAKEMALTAYWDRALGQARTLVAQVPLLPLEAQARQDFGKLFRLTPSPLQEAASGFVPWSGPNLVFLEDLTGAGKTEAALYLAHTVLAAGLAQGFYLGLPTMATADQMFARVADACGKFYKGRPLVMLAHGARNTNARFRDDFGLDRGQGRQQRLDGLESAERMAVGWLADNNKKALLAALGVGTVDQMLLGVLRMKHAPLRLFGLMGKVLIIDELHAYDSYMQKIFEYVIDLHTRQGGTTLLLSATLARRQRAQFMACFLKAAAAARGELGRPAVPVLNSAYPLLTHVDGAGGLVQTAVAARMPRAVAVRFVAEAPVAEIVGEAAAGRCVCWIRNTIGDAVAAFEALRALVDPERLQLFHARFALVDRLRIQAAALARFGKAGDPGGRRGQILIATQVVEQSLDLDFDALYSDLAPIDLLIQRAGRQHRHRRDAEGRLKTDPGPDGRGQQVFTVFGPAWDENPGADWFKKVFPGASYVYADSGDLLWETQRVLQEEGQLLLPERARYLVERVYDDSEPPPGLADERRRREGAFFADRNKAEGVCYHPEEGYQGILSFDEHGVVGSRLGMDQHTFVLAVWQGGCLEPYAKGHDQAWFHSRINLPKRWCDTVLLPELPPDELVLLEAQVKNKQELPQLKYATLLVMVAGADGCFRARVCLRDRPLVLVYDPLRGALRPEP